MKKKNDFSNHTIFIFQNPDDTKLEIASSQDHDSIESINYGYEPEISPNHPANADQNQANQELLHQQQQRQQQHAWQDQNYRDFQLILKNLVF